MKKIDVFFDLEGLGISGGLEGGLRKIEFIGDHLSGALEKEGFVAVRVQGYASYMQARKVVLPWKQRKISAAFAARGWTMRWSKVIADAALISDAKAMLADGSLSEAVLIVTNDHDFCPLIAGICASGRHVLVSGESVSTKLRRLAHKTIPFWEFLGGHPDKILPGIGRQLPPPVGLPNGLLLPDL